MFAALQLQVNLSSSQPLPTYEKQRSTNDEDIDAALNELQITLEGQGHANGVGMNGHDKHVPELSNYLKFMKPRRFTLKSFKRLYFVFKEARLSVYK